MTETPVKQTFPRRDADGRVISLREFLVSVLVGTVLSLAVLAAIDGVVALLGLGEFGDATGWFAVVLPIFLFVDDFRGWKRAAGWRRLTVALVGLVLGIGTGLMAATFTAGLPPMVSGCVGAIVFGLVYTIIWYVWIRWLTGQNTSEDAS